MTAEHFGALSLPVGEFLAMEHDTEYVAANREVRHCRLTSMALLARGHHDVQSSVHGPCPAPTRARHGNCATRGTGGQDPDTHVASCTP